MIVNITAEMAQTNTTVVSVEAAWDILNNILLIDQACMCEHITHISLRFTNAWNTIIISLILLMRGI